MGSRAGEVKVTWGGEERTFRLGLGELRKIQEETGAGPTGVAVRCKLAAAAIRAMETDDLGTLAHVANGPFAEPPHVRFVLLQSLMGAGLTMHEATVLVITWFDGQKLSDSLLAVYEICMASILGPKDEPVGEAAGEGGETLSPKAASGSETITEPEPSPA